MSVPNSPGRNKPEPQHIDVISLSSDDEEPVVIEETILDPHGPIGNIPIIDLSEEDSQSDSNDVQITAEREASPEDVQFLREEAILHRPGDLMLPGGSVFRMGNPVGPPERRSFARSQQLRDIFGRQIRSGLGNMLRRIEYQWDPFTPRDSHNESQGESQRESHHESESESTDEPEVHDELYDLFYNGGDEAQGLANSVFGFGSHTGVAQRPMRLEELNALMRSQQFNRRTSDANGRGIAGMYGGFGPGAGDNVPQEIIQEIEAREERARDDRSRRILNAASPIENQLRKEAHALPEGYTCSPDPESDDDLVCALCGVVLGVGIPDNFHGAKLGHPFRKYVRKYGVPAPFQALDNVRQVERDLSRRVFVAKCGHAFCGNCVRNYERARNMSSSAKRSAKAQKESQRDLRNPFVFAPTTCPAEKCSKKLNLARTFTEMFL